MRIIKKRKKTRNNKKKVFQLNSFKLSKLFNKTRKDILSGKLKIKRKFKKKLGK